MSFQVDTSGSFNNLERFLKQAQSGAIFDALSKYGAEGVTALAAATPKDSGEAADAWYYEIVKEKNSYSIIWDNSKMVGSTPLVVLLQLGHGTGTGGYVQGRDFINPALRPIFERMANDAWKAVTS
jgi:hypothetical protein